MVFWDTLDRIERMENKLDTLLGVIRNLSRKELNYMSAEFDALKAEMARNAEVDAAAVAKLTELVAQQAETAAKVEELVAKLAEEQKDNAEIAELATTLRGQNDALAAAVASFSAAPPAPEPEANTAEPAAPEVVVEPAPEAPVEPTPEA